QSMLEVLRANLLSDIQHELLYVPIFSVEQLRHTVRTRERFLKTISMPSTVPRGLPRRHVSEVTVQATMDEEDDVEESENLEVDALTLSCWNCGKSGHRYQDCVAVRKVFCYGCGKRDTYRPSCTKCAIPTKPVGAGTVNKCTQTSQKGYQPRVNEDNSLYNIVSEIQINPARSINANVDNVCSSGIRNKQRKGNYIKSSKEEKRAVLASVVDITGDPRPYAQVKMLGKTITGLMDTGATINCIGGKLAEEILANNTEYTQLSSSVKTADGNRQRICGKLSVPVQFKGKI
ncbi:hypothetical protein KR215_007183, partial [Drosophila sulfurigaster]